jgi:hypothetical protein
MLNNKFKTYLAKLKLEAEWIINSKCQKMLSKIKVKVVTPELTL